MGTLFSLDSLRRQTVQALEIIVADNASSDNSASVAARDGVKWIALDRNYGFARAVNAGIQAATGDSLAIINNDVTLAPDCLSILDATLSRHAFATPKIVQAHDPARIDGTFDLTSRAFCSWRAGSGSLSTLPVWNRGTAIQSAPMTAALFRRSVFDTVGKLDEQFGSYLEDVDFGLRCAISGLSGVYVPNALGHHQGSATLGRWHAESVRQIARNQLLLIAKHYPRNWIARYGWPVLIAQTLWGVVALRHGAGFAFLKGKLEGLRSFGPMRGAGTLGNVLQDVLRQSEREIHELQNATGFDPYWRLYFALT